MSLDIELQMMFRLLLACILGAAVGLERESGERPAGFRTHTLVCMGSCLFMIVSMYGFGEFTSATRDPARLAAQVVSGVGFLGAGTIMHEGVTVKGLTTAASIWMVSAIGLTIGAGMYVMGIFATILMLATLIILGRWGKAVNFSKRSERSQLKIVTRDDPGNLERIMQMLEIKGVRTKAVNVSRNLTNDTITLNIYLQVSKEEKENFNKMLLSIEQLDYITSVENASQVV